MPLYVGMRTVASSRQQQILVLTSFVNHHRRSVCVGMCVYECVGMSVCGYTSIVKIFTTGNPPIFSESSK